MSYTKVAAQKKISSKQNSKIELQPVDSNRLEALKVLTNTILREIELIGRGNETVSHNMNLADEIQRFEIDLIRCALIRAGGRQCQAAKLLNVKITTLNAKIKRHGISLGGLNTENEQV